MGQLMKEHALFQTGAGEKNIFQFNLGLGHLPDSSKDDSKPEAVEARSIEYAPHSTSTLSSYCI